MENKSINHFKKKFMFLSNFYKSKFKDKEGNIWPSVEHYFQAMKTNDYKEREEIRVSPNPGSAKKKGRNVKLRDDWDQIKEDVMYEGLYYKFTQNENLRRKLIETGDLFLKEGNYWHDNIWGDCYCQKCEKIKGKNILGHLLMTLRTNLKEHI